MPTIATIDGARYIAINGNCYDANNLTVLPTIRRTVYGAPDTSEYVVGIRYELRANLWFNYFFPQTSRTNAWSIARKIKELVKIIKEG